MGILEWVPDQFWRSTPWDLSAAFDGWLEKNGHKDTLDPLSREEFEQLKARFPDGGH